MTAEFILYSYYRSSASFRVRIALNLKKIEFEYRPVHLLNDGGQQFKPEYLKLNPMAQVPCLIHQNQPISQSMAIIQYLDDIYPKFKLFPEKALDRAVVVQICETLNSGIQPLQNSAVVTEIGKRFSASSEQKTEWMQHWINKGLVALEETFKKTSERYCFGDTVTAADCFLIPQVVSSKRFGVDMTPYKNINKIYENAMELEAFQKAEPSRQPDAQ